MKLKILYASLAIAAIVLGSFLYWQNKASKLRLQVASFQDLPAWNTASVQTSLKTFQKSCELFLNMEPEQLVGSQHISMRAKDWQPACRAAMKLKAPSEKTARNFFKKWFVPVAFSQEKPLSGLFTGYYVPYFKGSLKKTDTYQVPVYGLPADQVTIDLGEFDARLANRSLVGRVENHKVLPYYTREQINQGAIKDKAPVLVWLKSHIDHLFLEIQGSGIIELEDGKLMNIGYAGENGASYVPVGRVLVERGVMDKKTASMQGIRAYLEAHPKEILPVINQNKSFVFFRIFDHSAALGAQGVHLTPGFSLAVDRKWIPLGTPLWLNTTRPKEGTKAPLPLQRLMIAQDTGGAIRGAVRGDVFWGGGDKATYIAGTMKNRGQYWLLLPRHKIKQLPKEFE